MANTNWNVTPADGDMTDLETTNQQGYRYDTGATIYDSTGAKIGTLSDLGVQNGYLVVKHGMLMPKEAYVPVNLIQEARADGIYLSLAKDELNGYDQGGVPGSAPNSVAAQGGGNAWVPGAAMSGEAGQARTQLPPLYVQAEQVQAEQRPRATHQPLNDETDRTNLAGAQGDQIAVPLTGEELVAGKRQVERGRVQLRKGVTEERQTVDVPLTQEHVSVSEVPVDADTPVPDDAFQDKIIDVPVMGEELVTEKRAQVTGEVVVNKERVQETQRASATVRRERLDVRHVDEQGNLLGNDGQAIGDVQGADEFVSDDEVVSDQDHPLP
jgi:uncharacterized protein (TIGR02271 family)